jgi:hypothetical protein
MTAEPIAHPGSAATRSPGTDRTGRAGASLLLLVSPTNSRISIGLANELDRASSGWASARSVSS